MTIASAQSGMVGLPVAHFQAAAGALAAIPFTWRWNLQTGAGADLTPSMHWPAPIISREVERCEFAGPVLVTVDYRVEP
ncbi:MAG: hypothetical protein WBP86_09795 [Thiobacillaceae bacterium]